MSNTHRLFFNVKTEDHSERVSMELDLDEVRDVNETVAALCEAWGVKFRHVAELDDK